MNEKLNKVVVLISRSFLILLRFLIRVRAKPGTAMLTRM